MGEGRVKQRPLTLVYLLLVVVIFGYFLLFAQFALLHMLESAFGVDGARALMLPMVAGGVGGSFAVARAGSADLWRRWLLAGFLLAAVAPLLSLLYRSLYPVEMLVSLMTGLALGILTVSLVTIGALLLERTTFVIGCALGTGFAYVLCNLPVLFEGSYPLQALVAIGMALAGVILASWRTHSIEPEGDRMAAGKAFQSWPFWLMTMAMTILIMTDSAAFYEQQGFLSDYPVALRHVIMSVAHLLGALLVMPFLSRGHWRQWLPVAFLGLVVGHLLLTRTTAQMTGNLVYFGSVSIYSVLLISVVPLLSESRGVRDNWRRTSLRVAMLFSLAGWLGSGAGIGMVQDLGRVPSIYWVVMAMAMLVLSGAMVFRSSKEGSGA